MTILQQYQQLQAEQPKLRTLEAAKALGISEAQLFAAMVGDSVIRLKNDFGSIVKDLKKLNHVMALTRNALVVNEIKGPYEKIYVSERNNKLMGMAINPGGIDLRLFLNQWHSVYAQLGERHNAILFFDKFGCAVQKVYTTEQTDLDAYHSLVAYYKHPDQDIHLDVLPLSQRKNEQATELADEKIDIDALRDDWEKLTDVHHFPKMLKDHQVTRMQALRLIGRDWAFPLPSNSLVSILEAARDSDCEIMAFVGNDGVVQIYSGKVSNLKQVGPWYNVLDENFNLHAKVDEFSQAYAVKKPTDNTSVIVSSIEFFDKNNNTVLTLFGRRIEGKQQSKQWKKIISDLWPL